MIKKITVISSIVFFSQVCYAQFGTKIAGQLIDKSIQKKSSKSTTKDEISAPKENQTSNETEEINENTYSGTAFGSGSSKKDKVKPEYIFQSNVVMQVEIVDKTGKSTGKNEMIMHISKESNYSGTEMKSKDTQGNISIFDWTSNIMISLMNQEGNKIGMVMDLDANNKSAETKQDAPMKFTKTGKTKSILGYMCDEYIAENDDSSIDMWVTQSLDFNVSKNMEYFSKQSNTSNYTKDAPQGFMMEATTTEKKKGGKSIMQVTQVNKFANTTFKTSDYTFY